MSNFNDNSALRADQSAVLPPIIVDALYFRNSGGWYLRRSQPMLTLKLEEIKDPQHALQGSEYPFAVRIVHENTDEWGERESTRVTWYGFNDEASAHNFAQPAKETNEALGNNWASEDSWRNVFLNPYAGGR